MHPGPINRGVEIDGRVADSPDSLILQQVRAGLAVRMAVLHDLLTADVPALRSGGGRMTLFCKNGRSRQPDRRGATRSAASASPSRSRTA